MLKRDRPHIIIRKKASSESYRPHSRPLDPEALPSTDRLAHATALKAALEGARDMAKQRRAASRLRVDGTEPGIYVLFESHKGLDLKLDSLENKPQGIELMAVTEEADIQRAVLFVPEGGIKHFIQRFEDYASKDTDKGEPRHRELVERIASLRLATLRALWTDDPSAYPEPGQAIWWEVWLRRHDGRELARFNEFAVLTQMQISDRRLEFDDRIVTLVHGTPEQLSASIDVLNDIAEIQAAKVPAAPFLRMSGAEQGEWVRELLARTRYAAEDAPAVCVLDTGVARGHPLLEHSLSERDSHACDADWGSSDHQGHGTEMAGLALYGDMERLLASAEPVQLRHRLESVKILPPHGESLPELWGAITAEGVRLIEKHAPSRRRAFSMAVTADDTRDRGQPTSWSAAIDALAAGRSFDATSKGLIYDGQEPTRRLFFIAAGNIETPDIDHLTRSDVEPIHDPGQAWNVLTVGAYTERVWLDPQDASLDDWRPLAPHGELSPYSSTSITFESQWPIKPDIVMEGGNKALSPGGLYALQTDDLSLLTTALKSPLGVTWATSAATAQAARLAALISAEYPRLWPETIRALIVHSAEWTRRMRGHFEKAQDRRKRLSLFRRYGFGVPSLDRALRSAANAMTLIVQDTLHPFKDGVYNEMHLHALSWPQRELEALGLAQVRLRVTLSYFIEPHPGRRGWRKRHRYSSHGLRFDIKRVEETPESFRKRLNQQALEEEETRPRLGAEPGWVLGRERNKGSLHSDIWEGSAAELAERGLICVYPVTGWWKEQQKRDRSPMGVRYALVVSIETERTDVDLWTPVAQQVEID